MKKLLLLFAFISFIVFGCDYVDSDWDPPSNNLPTGNYLYQSSTMYFEKNGEPDPKDPIEGSGYLRLTSYVGSADIDVIPELGWTYQIHLSGFYEHTLDDGTIVMSFSINPQEVNLDYNYYEVMGTNNKPIRNTDGSLIGYYDGYIKGDSLVYEFRSNNGFEGWTIADIKARTRN